MAETAAQRVTHEAWAALRMIRDAIEELGPVGVLPSDETVQRERGPMLADEAAALVEGIRRIAHARPASVGRQAMADDKTKKGAADRRTVSAGEGYEVSYFAKKHGITKEQAQGLLAKVGGNREKLNAAAEKLKK